MSEKTLPPAPADEDLFPALGNLHGKTLQHLRDVLEQGDATVTDNYESLVEDFIETFSHAVMQGVPPEWALFSFAQALAITLGQCIRANLDPCEGGRLIAMIVKNADLSAKMVKEVTVTN